MSISSVGAGALSQWFALERTRESTREQTQAETACTACGPANAAAPGSILPPVNSSLTLSFETILSLQSLDDPAETAPAEPSAADKFLEEARKSPIERMREQILQELGLTEEGLAGLPPDERRAAEDKIRAMVEERLRQASGAGDGAEASASNAATLGAVA